MKFNKFFFVLTIVIASCNTETTQQSAPDNSKVLTLADGDYIQFPDATKWNADWKKDNTLTIHWMQEPDNLHPCNGRTLSRSVVFSLIHRSLVALNPLTRKLAADLIKEIPESADGKTFHFTLQDEPAFNDGTKLTTDDVLFSFKTYKCSLVNSAVRNSSNGIENVTAESAESFTITFKNVLAGNLFSLTDFPILERKFYDAENVLGKYSFTDFEKEMVATKADALSIWAQNFNDGKFGNDVSLIQGLGAYQITDWQRGQTLTLTKKENHWTQKLSSDILNRASPEKIIFKIITDENALLLAARNQDFDASFWLPGKVLMDLQKDSVFNQNYYSCYTASYDYSYIGFNTKPTDSKRAEIFDDLNVRKAFALLTPVDQIIANLLGGKALRMTSIVSPLKKDVFVSWLKPYEFNIDEAKKLLSDAGWSDTDGDKILDKKIGGKKIEMKVELLFPLGPSVIRDMALLLKDAYAKAGIDLQPVVLDPNALGARLVQHDFDMYLGGLSSSSAPDDFTNSWSHSSWQNHGMNFTGFGNGATDAIIDSIKSCLNESKRIETERAFQKMVYDDYPIIPLYYNVKKIAVNRRWANVIVCFDKPYILFGNLELMSNKLSY